MNVCTCKSICDRSILCNEVTDRGDMVHRAQLRDLSSIKPSVVHIRFGLSSSSAVQKKVCNFSSLCDKSLALFDGSVPHFFFLVSLLSRSMCLRQKPVSSDRYYMGRRGISGERLRVRVRMCPSAAPLLYDEGGSWLLQYLFFVSQSFMFYMNSKIPRESTLLETCNATSSESWLGYHLGTA